MDLKNSLDNIFVKTKGIYAKLNAGIHSYTKGLITGVSSRDFLRNFDYKKTLTSSLFAPDDFFDPFFQIGVYESVKYLGKVMQKKSESKKNKIYKKILQKGGKFLEKHPLSISLVLTTLYEAIEYLGVKTPISEPCFLGTIKDVASRAVTVYLWHNLTKQNEYNTYNFQLGNYTNTFTHKQKLHQNKC